MLLYNISLVCDQNAIDKLIHNKCSEYSYIQINACDPSL